MNNRDRNRIVSEVLRKHGFSATKNSYIKVSGDMILSVFWVPSERTFDCCGKKGAIYVLCFAVQSLYAHKVFSNDYTPNVTGGSMRPVSGISDRSAREEIEEALVRCVNTMYSVTTQADLYDYICRNDIIQNGEILMCDSNKIAPLLSCERYAEALNYCKAIVKQNEVAFAVNMGYLCDKLCREEYEITYTKRQKTLDEKLEYLRSMIQWIGNKDTDKINECLFTDRELNCKYINNTLRIH